jgi:adenylate cyclase
MALAAGKLRVLIPTTSGPAEVLLLTEEDAAIGRSVACIGGTTAIADIAADYHAFVVRPTGVIEGLFGHSCYRLDLSARIDAGSSWQLGVLVAHALHAAGRLAQENEDADGVIWATGGVRAVDLTVGGVSHIPEKLASSLPRLREEAAAGRAALVAIPVSNAPLLSPELRAGLAAGGIAVLELAHVQLLWDALAIKLPIGPGKAAATPARTGRSQISVRFNKRHLWGAGTATAALLCLVASAIYLRGQFPATVVSQQPASAQKERGGLVPEMIPLVSEHDHAIIRDVYMSALDHKAIALGATYMGFVTAQPDKDTAEKAAVAVCQSIWEEKRANAGLGPPSTRCELYASGNNVVWARPYPPMPPQPWIIRDPLIETPYTAQDVPLVQEQYRKIMEQNYARSRKPKALAVSVTGNYGYFGGEPSSEEAVRRTLEWCGDFTQTACQIVALDDRFIVPVPRLRKVVGLFRSGPVDIIAPEFRDEVARQLRNATKGWSAVAVGASGRVGIKLGAESEQAAIDAAMQACGRRDRDCRILVIGPFLVDSGPPANAGPVPAAPARSADTTKALMAALEAAAPGLKLDAREDLATKYADMKDHRALAAVPGTASHWRTGEWPSAAMAEEGVLERCQEFHARPCTLVAVDDKVQAAPTDGSWPARDMPRVRYAGTFDPDQIPGILPGVRTRADVIAYRKALGPKAAAFHPWGRIFVVPTAESQRVAETLALSICNADPTRQGQDGPCRLYASGDQVVLPRRATGPLTP